MFFRSLSVWLIWHSSLFTCAYRQTNFASAADNSNQVHNKHQINVKKKQQQQPRRIGEYENNKINRNRNFHFADSVNQRPSSIRRCSWWNIWALVHTNMILSFIFTSAMYSCENKENSLQFSPIRLYFWFAFEICNLTAQ